jgi:hypothetical protein
MDETERRELATAMSRRYAPLLLAKPMLCVLFRHP